MTKKHSYLSIATALAASICAAIIVVLPARAVGQDVDPYKAMAAQSPTLADAPLEFKVISVRKMINGTNQFAGWTPVISGRMLGRTRKGDAVVVELSQDGKLIHTLRAGLSGNGGNTWYEDWDIRGDDTKDRGTNLYTDDSSVFVAAVHAGLITLARGGNVTIEIRPGASSYTGTSSNSVKTRNYGAYSGSFIFVQ